MLIRNDLRSVVSFSVAPANVQKNVAVDSFEAARGFGGSSGSGNSGSGSSGSGNKSTKGGKVTPAASPVQQCNIPTPAKAAGKVTPAQTPVQQLPAQTNQQAPAPAKVPAPAATKFPEPPVAAPAKL